MEGGTDMCKVRLLKASEIDCRTQQVKETGCSLLLYKDARCDMAILDETFGDSNWQRSHEFKNGKCYCTISVWVEDRKEWISREDVGVPSNTEGEKGEASDSFKRAAVNFGIGRELYTSPFIWVKLDKSETFVGKSGKPQLEPSLHFRVAEIGYNEQREIDHLIIVDNKGNARYTYGKVAKKRNNLPEELRDAVVDSELNKALEEVQKALTMDVLKAVWVRWKAYQKNPSFKQAKDAQKEKLEHIERMTQELELSKDDRAEDR